MEEGKRNGRKESGREEREMIEKRDGGEKSDSVKERE